MIDSTQSYFSEDDFSDDSSLGEDNYFYADAVGELDDEIVAEVDFSNLQGKSVASSLNKFNRIYDYKNRLKKRRVAPKLPLTKAFGVRNSATIYGADGSSKEISKIIVPDDKRVIVEGVDKFILGHGKSCDDIKNIGYYKCKKLKELIITMNNNSKTDFNLELFNPSMPLDYLFATSGNLNNKVTVAGGVVSYSDVLYNILANPTHIVNAKFTYANAGALNVTAQQIAQPMFFKNKRIDGTVKVEPLNTQLQLDIYQFQPDVLFFDFQNTLNRPFIPDGMDVIQYKVLAGASVTFSFYYRQKSLKRFFFAEAKDNRKLL